MSARHWLIEPRSTRTQPSDSVRRTVLCLSYLGNASPMRVRLLARRLRRRAGGSAKIVLGVWSVGSDYVDDRSSNADAIVTSLSDAANLIAETMQPVISTPALTTSVAPLRA